MAEPQIGTDGWYDDWPEWAKNFLSEGARHMPWRDMPMPAPMTTDPRTRAYVHWMRLTHNGRRMPSAKECSQCGDRMSEEQITEYRRDFVPGPARSADLS